MFYDQKHKPHLQEIYSHTLAFHVYGLYGLLWSCRVLRNIFKKARVLTNSQTISLLLYNTWRVVGVQSTVQKNLIKSWKSKIDTFSSTPFSISNRCWYHVGSKSMFLPNHHKLCCVCHLYILYLHIFLLSQKLHPKIPNHSASWVNMGRH